MSTSTDHADLWAYESAACAPTEWENWITTVEFILGHSADGDSATDGYSLDDFHNHWKAGVTPAQAVASTQTADATTSTNPVNTDKPRTGVAQTIAAGAITDNGDSQ